MTLVELSMFFKRNAISLFSISIRSFHFRSSHATSSKTPNSSASYTHGESGPDGGFRRLHDAVSCFDAIVKMQALPPVKEFSRVLSIVVWMRHYSAAVALIKEMHSRGVGLNVYIWGILMNCLCRLRRVELCFAILGRVLKLDFKANLVMLNTLYNTEEIRCKL
ncbi:pentatricopeptide repeat-containing protein At1g62670, mitochondrial-like [Eucalyptus grandis]|uniref:pentatricopeptide repeat-containing protein At1g62670, mitochondrial-like n=1 Tax=Eucalyptus grandis TaxID=71139 RepID=UPI00192F10C1|nr:pentatricopeptide repeat-containing protein At1g62670, mitochondrial-like [Eucalyptus grandis]